jgi:major vault protein
MTSRRRAHNTEDTLNIIRIPPNQYIHVSDNNKNIKNIVTGPQTFVRKEHETVLGEPEDMIVLPPGHYCIINNPVVRDKQGKPVINEHGEYQLRLGRQKIRQSADFPEPFPLYPGEEVEKETTAYRIVENNTGLIIKVIRDIGDKRAGDRWLFKGPGVYISKIEETIEKEITASIIKQNQALKIRALRDTVVKDVARTAGEVWLEREQGAYLPSVDEEIITSIEGKVLTDKKALQLRATADFIDYYGVERKAGEEWLVTKDMVEVHIKDVYEDIVGEIKLITLAKNQYCVVLNPMDEKGIPQFGKYELRRGEATFFLKPGEFLKDGIQVARVLSEHQLLLLQAREDFVENEELKRSGMKWVVRGPREYIPPAEVVVVEERESIPLDENEGIYVKNIKTGEVRIVKNTVYMLTSEEVLWEKELSDEVEELLSFQASGSGFAPVTVSDSGDRSYAKKKPSSYKRVKTRAITFRAPHNSAVQLFDYKAKKSRIVFGPDLVMLEPYEEITVLRLSGNVPKRENQLKNLVLLLGPDFMTDQIIVETSDHARLYLRLAYSWKFDIDKTRPETYSNIFSVSDFVGEACKTLASRIRGAVSGETFEVFHRNSSEIIQQSIFKKDESGNKIPFLIKTNNLLITSVDIQGVEPVEESTRKSLEMSVKLSIDITTKTQEDKAKHEAERLE